jgi:hypothetical protein
VRAEDGHDPVEAIGVAVRNVQNGLDGAGPVTPLLVVKLKDVVMGCVAPARVELGTATTLDNTAQLSGEQRS